MASKSIRQKGKLALSKVFADIKIGDKVALVRNLSFPPAFPEHFHGRTGTVAAKQGKSLVVSFYDGNVEKKIVAQKIHLKKLSS